MPAAAFFAAGFDLGVAAAFFGFGAFGFLVGGLAVFLALGAAAFAFAGAEAAAFLAAGFFLAAAAFLSLVAALAPLLGDDADEEEADAAFLDFAAAAEAVFFDLPAEEAAPLPPALPPPEVGFFEADDLDSNLKDPDAPLPFVWIKAPDSTALFRYFLMNGANFSASTLYWAAMYFLIACSDDPLRSFSSLMAFVTISEVFGCVGFALAFFTPPAAADALGCFFAGVAGAGASDATAVSAIFFFLVQ